MIQVEKVIEVILGLVMIFKGEIQFGCTLLAFGLITCNVKL